VTGPLLLYGANGYSGELIARAAAARGERPILAGRNGAEVGALARELGLEHRVFGLDDPAALDRGLAGIATVLHCAGPFSRTFRPMADGCLRARAHYLDITGEIDVFEALAALDAEARQAGVMLLPGVGFDVVPSDCLAAHLKRRLPAAAHLSLGFQSVGGMSRGTATTAMEKLHKGGAVRRGGRIIRVPPAWKARTIDFGAGPKQAVTIPWGDVATAFHSTGIPDIEVFSAMPPSQVRMLKLSRWVAPLLATAPVQAYLRKRIRAAGPGPSPERRARSRTYLWGEATDAAGGRVVSRLAGPGGYDFTVETALLVARRVAAGEAPAGYQTPAKAYGPDLVLEVPGVTRSDEP
jgi:short subunit dehydrogenase-like uncharacterized protein